MNQAITTTKTVTETKPYQQRAGDNDRSDIFLGKLTVTLAVIFSVLATVTIFRSGANHPVSFLLLFCTGIAFSIFLHLLRTNTFKRMGQMRIHAEQRAVELKHAVAQSQENENKYRRISESIPLGIFELDETGVCKYTNNNWRTLCLASNVTKTEHRWVDILCSNIRENAFEDWNNAASKCSNFRGVYQQKTKMGEYHWLEFSISPVFSDEGTVFVGIAEDITEKKIAHDKLRQIVKELEVAKVNAEQSAQAKGEFLANMSHEIRTPITAILGYTDLLLDETPHNSFTDDSLNTIKRNGEHLLQVINDILDISKIEAGKLEVDFIRCSPRKIVEESVELISGRAKEKLLSLETEYEGLIPEFIQTDPTRFRQILLNLLSNAIKFTKTGGVKVKVQFEKWKAGKAEPQLKISVIDTGIGLTAQQASKLFQPFTQADNSTSRQFGGTGLGLSISQRLAEKLGGSIKVTSKFGTGTTFCTTISTGDLNRVSMLNYTSTETKSASAESHFHTGSKTESDQKQVKPLSCKLLLVEDGEDNQRLISFLMKKAGAEVTIAENGKIGVEKVENAIQLGSPFDIILMDMQMPVMDGYTAVRELRSSDIQTPIVALTANAMVGDREKCIQAGCTDYATKPIDRKKLIATVKKLLKTKMVASC